ncbi:MAG: helix-turn-helix domain-containing protein [Ottowia sp.]|nr:helix-turn-helix domain-containing protein [Ottowia sp.]MCB2036290.1 helix-turn-helix domain-containing protein [Ottowia sp.]
MSQEPTGKTNTLQTLDRGLQALDVICQLAQGITVAELAAALQVNRAIAYRLVNTLELHGLVARAAGGRIVAGAGVARLGAGFAAQFRARAQPVLARLAAGARATAFLVVAQADECTAVEVCEPQHVDIRVGYRVGSRHPITSGAPGIAILASRAPQAGDSAAVRQAREQGYSITRGEVQAGAIGIASAVSLRDVRGRVPFEAAVGVVTMQELDSGRCVPLVTAAAQELAQALPGV